MVLKHTELNNKLLSLIEQTGSVPSTHDCVATISLLVCRINTVKKFVKSFFPYYSQTSPSKKPLYSVFMSLMPTG